MEKVLCSHKMNTTNFTCKDPDHSDGRKYLIPVMAGVHVWVDERIAKAFPSTFIPVEAAPEAECEEIKDTVEPEPTLDEIVNDLVEDVEPEDEAAGYSRGLVDVKEDAENEGESFVPVEGVDFENVEDISDVEAANAKETADEVDAEILADVIDEAKSEDDEKAELLNTIDAFKSKKKLDVFAATLKVELDGRKKLADMKVALKEALELI